MPRESALRISSRMTSFSVALIPESRYLKGCIDSDKAIAFLAPNSSISSSFVTRSTLDPLFSSMIQTAVLDGNESIHFPSRVDADESHVYRIVE